MKRTMLELERDMAQNEVNRRFGSTIDAIANGKAEYAAQFASALLRAARRLHARQAAVNAEQRRARFAEWRTREAFPALRLVAPVYAAEIAQAYSDDAPTQANMRGELWINESELNLDAVGRYADPQCACEGVGASRDCEGEWELCDCVKAAV